MNLIFTEALKSTGLGHLGRCTALAEILKDQGRVVEIILHSDGTPNLNNYELPVQMLNWKKLDVLDNILEKTNIYNGFVDSYLAEPNIYEYIFKKVKNLISIDDTNRIPYPFGSSILNPGFSGNFINYDKNNYKIFSGPEFVLQRKPFRDDIRIPDLRENIESVLITMGGEDRLNLIPEIIKLLSINFPSWKKQVIIGPGFNNWEEIQKSKDEMTFFHKNLDAYGMKEVMLSVDLAITAGGQTTYEIARCGTPMIIIQVANNQEGNIKGFHNLGIATIQNIDKKDLLYLLLKFILLLKLKERRFKQRDNYLRIQMNSLFEILRQFN